MIKKLSCLLALLVYNYTFSQTYVIDSKTKYPVSYATISFGNGNGTFADNDGKFIFTKKLYNDIDSLYISALGYKNLSMASAQLKDTLYLEPKADELEEVLITTKPTGKWKPVTIKPTTHNDYYQCWLPTVESEIAVFFKRNSATPKKIESVLLPIKVEAKDWDKRKSSSANKRSFSTLFRVMFYENNNGKPGAPLVYDNIIFGVTQNSKKTFEIDVDEYDVFIPKNGIFVSVQVLGYTDPKGKLLPNKKYREVKTRQGIVKVSTTFRPLLPFTDKIENKQTFVKRIFLNNGKWQLFDAKNIKNSNLLTAGLNNYGMGLKLKVYKND